MAGLLNPQRNIIGYTGLEHYYSSPFGSNAAHNLLKGFDGSEPVEDDGTGLNVNLILCIQICKKN